MNAADFIRAWQTAGTVKGVAEAFGISAKDASTRAGRYRKAGIPLKKFPRGNNGGRNKLDIPALAALAESLAPKA